MFRNTKHFNTQPCPSCKGAQLKRKLGGMTEACKQCAGSGRVNKPKGAANGMFKKKIEPVPLAPHIETEETNKDCENAASEETENSKAEVKTKVRALGKTKSWSRKKKATG